MTLEKICAALGWCTVINGGILLAWFIAFTVAHDWIHDIHGNWFQLSKESFDAIHYGSMSFFKLSILLFNLTPYLALRVVGKK